MFTEAVKQILAQTLRRLLRPVVRVALRGSVTYRDFAELAKLAYFDVARDDYGLNGRKTNLARVAILTGLSRKECTRLKGAVATAPDTETTMSPVTRVIAAWHEASGYQDDEGEPLQIAENGPAPSLEDLLRHHGGDIPSGALQSELKRLGVAQATADGRWQVLKRSFIADDFTEQHIRIIGNLLTDLGNTIVYNLDNESEEDARIARYVVADKVTPSQARAFQLLATEKGQQLLQELDQWLTKHEHSFEPETASSDTKRVGMGVYFFEQSSDSGENT
jgi:hypothetical protein